MFARALSSRTVRRQRTQGTHAVSLRTPRTRPSIVSVQTRLVKRRRDVRYGSKADICTALSHVRFAPKSGRRWGANVSVTQFGNLSSIDLNKENPSVANGLNERNDDGCCDPVETHQAAPQHQNTADDVRHQCKG